MCPSTRYIAPSTTLPRRHRFQYPCHTAPSCPRSRPTTERGVALILQPLPGRVSSVSTRRPQRGLQLYANQSRARRRAAPPHRSAHPFIRYHAALCESTLVSPPFYSAHYTAHHLCPQPQSHCTFGCLPLIYFFRTRPHPSSKHFPSFIKLCLEHHHSLSQSIFSAHQQPQHIPSMAVPSAPPQQYPQAEK